MGSKLKFKIIFNLSLLVCSSALGCGVVFAEEHIIPIELRYDLVVEGDSEEFLSSVYASCPYVQIMQDSSSPNKIIVGTYEFIKQRSPVQLSAKTTLDACLLRIENSQTERGYTFGCSGSIAKLVASFSVVECSRNTSVAAILNRRLPISIMLGFTPEDENLCHKNEQDARCSRIVPSTFLAEALNQLIHEPGIGDYDSRMPYELSFRLIDQGDQKVIDQLILARNLNGARLKRFSLAPPVVYHTQGSDITEPFSLIQRISIMKWLAEAVADQEWAEEIVLEEAGINRGEEDAS